VYRENFAFLYPVSSKQLKTEKAYNHKAIKMLWKYDFITDYLFIYYKLNGTVGN